MNKFETLFEEFVKSPDYPQYNKEGFDYAQREIRKYLRTINDRQLSWEKIRREANRYQSKKYASQVMMLWVLFTIEIDRVGLLNDKYKGLFVKYKKSVTEYTLGTFKGKLEALRSPDFGPCSVVVTPRRKEVTGREKCRIFVIPGLTEEQHSFIMNYLSSMADEMMVARLTRGGIEMFSILFETGTLFCDFKKYKDDTFEEQFREIAKRIPDDPMYACSKRTKQNACLSELINLYNWIENSLDEETRRSNFKIYTLEVLKYQYFITAVKSGYKVVNYSIYENPPEVDKIIINPKNTFLHQNAEADKITNLDVSGITNDFLRKWVRECYWFDDNHIISTRTKQYSPIFEFVAIIDKKFKKTEKPKISVDDVLSFKASCVSQNTLDSTVARKLSFVKYFLNFLNENHYLEIDQLLFRLLIHHDNESNAYKETYTNAEIKQLLEAYKDSYEKCKDLDRKLLYTLYYYVIAIQSISEMRVSTILNLKTNCCYKTLDRNKLSEYKVVVQSKGSGSGVEEYNITRYVKGLIDEVKSLTDEFRKTVVGVEKEYLFIYRRHNRKVPGILRQDNLSTYHRNICKKYGIRCLRLGAIRNYYQQQVSNYVSKNGDDPMMIERLSKHGINVHIQHYDTVDIKDFCQRFYQVEIGSIELKGRVEENNNKPKENTVAYGCGHCELSKCILKGNLECLMCDKFVTTLDCIPFFEQEISRIDQMILNQPLQHEKEFLNNKKRLNVAYLTKLYELEAEINGNN